VDRGDDVVIIDDFSTGLAHRVPGIPVYDIDLADTTRKAEVLEVLRRHEVTAVVHFAAKKRVPESVERAAWYYEQNVGSLANLLQSMEAARVDRIVFSSSAAVYGAAEGAALPEDSETSPINPYGRTKLVGEWMLEDAVPSAGLRAASLRYFNVAGAGWPELADTAVLNLVPMVFERIDRGDAPLVFGDDYRTRDGSCVRDFVHVRDLADAHLVALDSLEAAPPCHRVYNVGTGSGTSVLEMVQAILDAAGSTLRPLINPRRAGDPAAVVADVGLIERELGWRAVRTLDDIVRSAWSAHRDASALPEL
jgi:UDP-glucose 4-epimerase